MGDEVGAPFGPCPKCHTETWAIGKDNAGNEVLRCHGEGCGFEVPMTTVRREGWIVYSETHPGAPSVTEA